MQMFLLFNVLFSTKKHSGGLKNKLEVTKQITLTAHFKWIYFNVIH